MKFYKAGEIPKVGNMYFIYGDGGTGKTSLTKLFDGRKLLLSFDGSTNALTDTDDIDVISFEYSDAPNMQKLVMSYLSKQIAKGEYQVVVLDNTTALQNWVLENIDGASKDGRQNYLKLQTWFRKLGDFLRESNLNILATAHQIDNGSTGLDGKGRFEADMNGRTFNAFTGPFDVVGRIYKENGERFIDLDTENGNHAKNRLDDRTLIKANELFKHRKERG
ncbi:AAA family ATPase [Weissella paramesenteroides]|uniref:AAA family ATPase n=1 Tax=Weissella paramesenteroides TaxID=1249 RepID=UPI00123BE40A|nr:AAA family ATPase [Weissella paramesenteroides]KAA8446961.1 AAA family ATPase [Weissella paramesenteroides]KAA8450597.1 AAA family ATPase [Weissella paramesenteroides]